MTDKEFWEECISQAACECDLKLTDDQLGYLAEAASGGHECYGMAFYSPPDSDRYNDIERDWEKRFKALQAEFDSYRENAETAVKQALGQYRDTNVSIGEYGEVLRHDGRTTKIQ
ncbi:hypothetical protein SRABI106_03509 [Rahnella aquatilis]|nr:hypothetical protein SRABI106_03509 [Rahnella aquatilis]